MVKPEELERDIEACTDATVMEDDWVKILDVCEKVKLMDNGPSECLRIIYKRMRHKIPQVAMLTLTVLDACVKNCGKKFVREVASRDFITFVNTLMNNKNTHPRVAQKLCSLIKKWAENETYKADIESNMIITLYEQLRKDGRSFDFVDTNELQQEREKKNLLAEQEESDLLKAIAASLDTADSNPTSSSTSSSAKKVSLNPAATDSSASKDTKGISKTTVGSSSSIYPNSSAYTLNSKPVVELRKVRALYDFEAAEDNELTFKAGEIILVTDDSDENWWKGSNHRGEGLFPVLFVTADLDAEIPSSVTAQNSRKEDTVVNKAAISGSAAVVESKIVIDDAKINNCLSRLLETSVIVNASGEFVDSDNTTTLEQECEGMAALIDATLVNIDKQHSTLTELNTDLVQALEMFNSLMIQAPAMQQMTANFQQFSIHPPGGYMQSGNYPVLSQGLPAEQYPGMQSTYSSEPYHLAAGQLPNNFTSPATQYQQPLPVSTSQQHYLPHNYNPGETSYSTNVYTTSFSAAGSSQFPVTSNVSSAPYTTSCSNPNESKQHIGFTETDPHLALPQNNLQHYSSSTEPVPFPNTFQNFNPHSNNNNAHWEPLIENQFPYHHMANSSDSTFGAPPRYESMYPSTN